MVDDETDHEMVDGKLRDRWDGRLWDRYNNEMVDGEMVDGKFVYEIKIDISPL